MRVVCPSCAAVYEVPEPMLGARARTLRCGRCAMEWTLPAPEPADVPEDLPEDAPDRVSEPLAESFAEIEAETRAESGVEPADAAADVAADAAPDRAETLPTLTIPERERPFVRADERPAAPRARKAGNGAAWLGWVASLVLLGLLAWGGYAYRGAVMHAWPPSERLYALLGLMAAHRP